MSTQSLDDIVAFSETNNFVRESAASLNYFNCLGINMEEFIEVIAKNGRKKMDNGLTSKEILANYFFSQVSEKIAYHLTSSSLEPNVRELAVNSMQIIYTALIYTYEGREANNVVDFLSSRYN